MQRTSKRLFHLVATAAMLLAVAACGPAAAAPTAPAVDEARATEIATNALEAFNSGDYAAWSRDWSQTMKSAIGESAFLSFREQAMASVGRYVKIESVERVVKKPGTYRWSFKVRFEKGTATVAFGFEEGSVEVAGVHFE